jgi:hypothetical protein
VGRIIAKQTSGNVMKGHIQEIRDLINKPIMQYPLLKNRALWNQLCSCLDVIGDSELAIDAYLNRKFQKSTGENYLAVYGLLQALFLQQDAVFNLCESLGIPEKIHNYPKLEEIRDVRSDSIGHPTKRNRKKGQPTSYHFISRPTLGPDGFQLLSLDSNGKLRSKDVSVPNLIKDQKTYLSNVLTAVIGELKHREKAHKEKFRMEKLASFFPDTLGYCFEKINLSTTTLKEPALGAWGVEQVKQVLKTFQEALAKRGIDLDTYDVVKNVYILLEYPLAELEAFFQNVENGRELNINERTAYIFAFFVEKQVNELKDLAREIDEDYSS